MEKERLKKIMQEVREYYGLSYQEFVSLVEVAYFNMRDRKEKILIHWKLPNGAYLDKIIISRCCPYRSRKYMISLRGWMQSSSAYLLLENLKRAIFALFSLSCYCKNTIAFP